ncbi:MAG: DUF975 family protein [Clostridiales bacterium]|nr:DUF975 family protein [Clostridiales bacterium]
MLKAKDLRSEAWAKLNGKWGTVALIALIYELIMGVCGALSYVYIGGIATLLVTGAFALGLAIVSLNVVRLQNVEVNQMFSGFREFGKAFLVNLLNSIFLVLWTLLFIVPGIIKSFAYSMSYYVLADNPALTATEVRHRSIELMRGNKWRLFCLYFSFIGWWLLCMLTLGILSFWIVPYQQAATAAFYQSLLPKSDTTEILPAAM